MSENLINKSAYIELINYDIERIMLEMEHSVERDHILQILQWSINQLYKNE